MYIAFAGNNYTSYIPGTKCVQQTQDEHSLTYSQASLVPSLFFARRACKK